MAGEVWEDWFKRADAALYRAKACGGNLVIDDGHRSLFTDANHLLGAVLSVRPKEEVATLVDKLLTDVVQHFKEEEVVICEARYPRDDHTHR